jgi:hypothetical protein
MRRNPGPVPVDRNLAAQRFALRADQHERRGGMASAFRLECQTQWLIGEMTKRRLHGRDTTDAQLCSVNARAHVHELLLGQT